MCYVVWLLRAGVIKKADALGTECPHLRAGPSGPAPPKHTCEKGQIRNQTRPAAGRG